MTSMKTKCLGTNGAEPCKDYHTCYCYGHNVNLPDYKKLNHPHTLQGHYAHRGGCPCCPKTKAQELTNTLCCPEHGGMAAAQASSHSVRPCQSGPHAVHKADGVPDGTVIRDGATGTRTVFPNARNYGGTVSQRGPTTLRMTKRKTRDERKEEKMQDRKNFLKAVLRDEMIARMEAEAERDGVEGQLELIGTNHYQDTQRLMESGKAATLGATERGIYDVPGVGEQYAEVLDELKFVAGQPVGSKLNIIRLHYLVEEQDRLNTLRTLKRGGSLQ